MAAGFFKRVGKIFSYSDGSYDRASMGDLADYTGPNGVLSPAQAGFRAIDQEGNAIFDSLGLIAVMKPLGGTPVFPSNFTTSSITFTKVPGMTATFSLTRATRIFACYGFAGKMTGAGGGTGNTTFLFIDGAIQQPDAPVGFNMSGLLWDQALTAFSNGTGILLTVLSAGQHTIDLRAVVGAGTAVLNVNGPFLFVLSAGAV